MSLMKFLQKILIEQLRLSIAIALIGNSKVILLDEPTTGLDLASRFQIWNLIQQIKKERAILLTTVFNISNT